jgi:hypothetical protein
MNQIDRVKLHSERKKRGSEALPLLTPHGMCLDSVHALDQIWFGVVRPVV